jgi:hypothetical protein
MLNFLKAPTKWWYGLDWQEQVLFWVHILSKEISTAENTWE